MARRNRIRIQFGGFEEYAERIDKMGGNLKSIMTKALTESSNLVAENAHRAMEKHHRTGTTEGQIVDNAIINWNGSIGTASVGFAFGSGEGLPSIFLMYGTPRMSKDTTLYNSIYGAATKRKIQALQKEIFENEIRRLT